jgi:hypothetical protein
LFVVRYRASFAFPLALASVPLAVAAIMSAARSGRASAMGALAGAGLAMVMTALIAAITYLFIKIVDANRMADHFGWFFAGAILFAAIVVFIVMWFAQSHVSNASMASGMIGIWMLLALATAHWIAGASYMPLFPLMLVSVATLLLAPDGPVTNARFAGIVGLCTAAIAVNAGHIYLAGLGLRLQGLHLVLVLPALALWLVAPVLRQAAFWRPSDCENVSCSTPFQPS